MNDKNSQGPEASPSRKSPSNRVAGVVAATAIISCILAIEPVDLKRGVYKIINGTTPDGKVIIKKLGQNSFVVIDDNGQEHVQEIVSSNNFENFETQNNP